MVVMRTRRLYIHQRVSTTIATYLLIMFSKIWGEVSSRRSHLYTRLDRSHCEALGCTIMNDWALWLGTCNNRAACIMQPVACLMASAAAPLHNAQGLHPPHSQLPLPTVSCWSWCIFDRCFNRNRLFLVGTVDNHALSPTKTWEISKK